MSSTNVKLLLIIIISLAFALLLFTQTHQPDQVMSLNYHFRNVDALEVGEPPVVFGILSVLACFMGRVEAWATVIVVPFVLGILSIYYLTQDLFHDTTISLFASLQYGTSTLVLILFSFGYAKQLFALFLMPLAILFFHRSLHTNSKKQLVLSGIIFGIIGLTHEITFVSLLTFYLAFIGFKMSIHRKIHFPSINKFIIISVVAILICGSFYTNEVSAITHAGGEKVIDNYSVFYVVNYSYLSLVFTFALIGVLVLKTHKHLMYSLLLGGLLLIMGWVGYTDRFVLQLIIPLSIFSGYGFKYILNIKNMNCLIYLMCAISSFSLILALVNPSDIINTGFDIIILPISILSSVFTGWFAVVLKFVLGVPLTIALWVITVKYLYYKLYKRGEGE